MPVVLTSTRHRRPVRSAPSREVAAGRAARRDLEIHGRRAAMPARRPPSGSRRSQSRTDPVIRWWCGGDRRHPSRRRPGALAPPTRPLEPAGEVPGGVVRAPSMGWSPVGVARRGASTSPARRTSPGCRATAPAPRCSPSGSRPVPARGPAPGASTRPSASRVAGSPRTVGLLGLPPPSAIELLHPLAPRRSESAVGLGDLLLAVRALGRDGRVAAHRRALAGRPRGAPADHHRGGEPTPRSRAGGVRRPCVPLRRSAPAARRCRCRTSCRARAASRCRCSCCVPPRVSVPPGETERSRRRLSPACQVVRRPVGPGRTRG